MNQTNGAVRQTQAGVLAVKKAVRARDGNRCVQCGMTNDQHRAAYKGKGLEVHRKAPAGAYTVDGCITLCRRCHGPQPRKARGAPAPLGAPLGQVVAFRVSDRTKDSLKRAAQRYGMTQTAILEALIDFLGRGTLTVTENEP